MRSRRVVVALAALLGAAVRPLPAQCPDGTPPPCSARRAPPRPDPRTWMVLPFTNVAHDAELQWLTDASVNLLYLDLSRWQDIRVIDDERVADAVRTLPEGQREGLGLNAGLALARRAGAGRLVMGDLLKSGSRTTVVAKVYAVTEGRRLRSVSEEFTSRDSTMPAYARLAGKVLDAPLPATASPDAVGTRSLDAYQEYAAGLRALSAWQLADARRHFERALEADTGFALAHYKVSIAIGWDLGFSAIGKQHAEAAARFASGLPARERALIRGQQQFSDNRYQEACDTFRGLVAADSTDVEAWYQLGECDFHNSRLEAVGGDSTRMRFLGSWAASYRAFQRTLALDPTMHLAYEHLVDMLRRPYRSGSCLDSRCARFSRALVEVRGDSVVAESAQISVPNEGFFPDPREAAAKGPRLRLAVSLAERWLAAAPEEAEAHYQYAVIFEAMGQFADAARETATARRLGYRFDARPVQVSFLLRADSQYNRGAAAAAALADSAIRFPSDSWQGADSAQRAWVGALYRADLAGLIGAFSRVPDRFARPPGYVEVPVGLARALVMLGAGIVPRDLDSVVARVTALRDTTGSARWLVPSVLWWVGALCTRLCTPSGLDSSQPWRESGFRMLVAGDTAGARTWLHGQDSTLAVNERRYGGWPPDAFSNALLHVALRDTSGALEALDAFERARMTSGAGLRLDGPTTNTILGRAWLLHADLLQATGHADDAVLYYRRVADLWAGGDPEVQPAVRRARSHLPPDLR